MVYFNFILGSLVTLKGKKYQISPYPHKYIGGYFLPYFKNFGHFLCVCDNSLILIKKCDKIIEGKNTYKPVVYLKIKERSYGKRKKNK